MGELPGVTGAAAANEMLSVSLTPSRAKRQLWPTGGDTLLCARHPVGGVGYWQTRNNANRLLTLSEACRRTANDKEKKQSNVGAVKKE